MTIYIIRRDPFGECLQATTNEQRAKELYFEEIDDCYMEQFAWCYIHHYDLSDEDIPAALEKVREELELYVDDILAGGDGCGYFSGIEEDIPVYCEVIETEE